MGGGKGDGEVVLCTRGAGIHPPLPLTRQNALNFCHNMLIFRDHGSLRNF